jgi:hypothetical protein
MHSYIAGTSFTNVKVDAVTSFKLDNDGKPVFGLLSG